MSDCAQNCEAQTHRTLIDEVTSGLVSLSVNKGVETEAAGASAAHLQTPSRPVRWKTPARPAILESRLT